MEASPNKNTLKSASPTLDVEKRGNMTIDCGQVVMMLEKIRLEFEVATGKQYASDAAVGTSRGNGTIQRGGSIINSDLGGPLKMNKPVVKQVEFDLDLKKHSTAVNSTFSAFGLTSPTTAKSNLVTSPSGNFLNHT